KSTREGVPGAFVGRALSSGFRGRHSMLKANHLTRTCAIAVAAMALSGAAALTQTIQPTNSALNPYRTIESWAKMPEGRIWGSPAAVDIDTDGTSIWVAERCSAQGFIPASRMVEGQPFNCDGVDLDPILKFDATGKLVKSFGKGLFVFPHGLHVD